MIITILLETYDRLIAFGQKHLSDPFVQEGLQSVSARDRILREIFSNSLAHRDYSSGYVAKFVIERNRLYTENANRSHGHGALHLSSFEPYAKNPPISKVFREIGAGRRAGVRDAEYLQIHEALFRWNPGIYRGRCVPHRGSTCPDCGGKGWARRTGPKWRPK